MITCPRTGITSESGTSRLAPIPEQLTMTGAPVNSAARASEVNAAVRSSPPARVSRASRYSR